MNNLDIINKNLIIIFKYYNYLKKLLGIPNVSNQLKNLLLLKNIFNLNNINDNILNIINKINLNLINNINKKNLELNNYFFILEINDFTNNILNDEENLKYNIDKINEINEIIKNVKLS